MPEQVKPTAECAWCGRRVQFSPLTGNLGQHHTQAKKRGKRRQTSPVCDGSNQHRDARPKTPQETAP